MIAVKNIVVPTDFSVTSRNAYQYAKKLAEKLDATVTVVHINEFAAPVAEVATKPSLVKEQGAFAKEMDLFITEENAPGDWIVVQKKVKTQVLGGSVVGGLLNLSKDEKTDMIVIGTTGLLDFVSKITGSISLDVLNKAHCPVILVPRDTKWTPIKSILYASNYDSATPKMMQAVTDFAGLLQAKIHFVHVQDGQEAASNKDAQHIWQHLFPDIHTRVPFEIHTIQGDNTIRELKEYAAANKISLLAFVSKHRNFWENLVHKSITQNIAISTDAPMLILHLDDHV